MNRSTLSAIVRRWSSVTRGRVLMASSSSSRFLIRRLLGRRSPPVIGPASPLLQAPVRGDVFVDAPFGAPLPIFKAFFSSGPSKVDMEQGPASIDYRSFLPEDDFHRFADDTICDLQEKFEEYGDSVQIDGFDIDYGNQVLTLKLGNLGTYVINKQTPNRQIWLSSPVSGPSRFDWDSATRSWVYRRTKAHLLKLLENEIEELCGKPIHLS